MRAAPSLQTFVAAVTRKRRPRPTTLLDLVRQVAELTDDDREIVATVLHLLRSGQVRLCGILRDTPTEELE